MKDEIVQDRVRTFRSDAGGLGGGGRASCGKRCDNMSYTHSMDNVQRQNVNETCTVREELSMSSSTRNGSEEVASFGKPAFTPHARAARWAIDIIGICRQVV